MPNYHKASPQTTPHTKYNKGNFTTNFVLDKAQRCWPQILESLGINPSHLKNKHGPCPVCGGKDRFRFDNKGGRGTFYCNQCGAGDGIKLLQNYHDWSFLEACNKVAQALGIPLKDYNGRARVSQPKHIKHHVNNIIIETQIHHSELNWRKKNLSTTWAQAKPIINGDPVDCYLKLRGIILTKFPSILRYHSNLPYYSDEKILIGHFPAMLALVTDQNNKEVTIHRTYLGDGCKADLPKPKKLMPAIRPKGSVGAAIKLYDPVNGKIALAEGIETAFSINIATGIPVWATISAGGLENIILPPSITETIIAVDNDVSNQGQKSADILTARLLSEGRKVKRVIPPKVGQDFNDLLLEDDI